MPALTARMSFYLPGGGSLSIGGDDEVADIDRINENFQKIDEALGAPKKTRASVIDPVDGQIIREDRDAYGWDNDSGQWFQINPHVGTTPPSSPQEGYLWVDTN